MRSYYVCMFLFSYTARLSDLLAGICLLSDWFEERWLKWGIATNTSGASFSSANRTTVTYSWVSPVQRASLRRPLSRLPVSVMFVSGCVQRNL